MHHLEHLEGRTLFASYAAANVSQLIAAMNAANASAVADEINLAAGATFTLTAVNNTTDTDGPNGLPVIVSSGGGLTIRGNGATLERSAAAGTPAFRLFGVAAGGSLVLSGLTLQGGLVEGSRTFVPDTGYVLQPAQGGAIYSQGSLQVLNCTIRNNGAVGLAGQTPLSGPIPACAAQGGAIYSGGSLLMNGAIVQNNAATGGIGHASGNPLFINWPPEKGADGSGGGVYLAGGAAAISNSTIASNTARGGFGGSFGTSSTSATADGGNGFGGGVFAAGGNLTLRSTLVSANAALGGDGRVLSGNKLGHRGTGTGGGIYIANANVGIDAFTVKNTKGNTATTTAREIFGTYTRIV